MAQAYALETMANLGGVASRALHSCLRVAANL